MIKTRIPLLGLFLFSSFLLNCGGDDEPSDPTAPLACFKVEGTLYAEAGVPFDASCTKNAEYFLWEFGDGDTSTEPSPTHIYDVEGQYNVRLTVQGGERTHTSEQKITVNASPFIKHSGFIDEPEVWQEGMHLVTGNVTIRHGSLTIEPGASIYMAKEKSIFVGHSETTTGGGAIFTAIGTESKPIIFQPSSSLEQPGEWGHLAFTSKASGECQLSHCEIKYGGKANGTWDYPGFEYYTDFGVLWVESSAVGVNNTKIIGAANFGISMADESMFSSFTNNTFSNNASYPINLSVNSVHTIGEGNQFAGSKGIYARRGWFEQTDAHWQKLDVPIIVGNIDHTSNSKLTIEAGSVIAIEKDAAFHVGTLIAEGTATEPITFTSAEETKAKGDWVGMSGGQTSILKYCIIEYGGGPTYNNYRDMLRVSSSTIVDHCKLMHSAGNAVSIDIDGDISANFTNNELGDSDKYGVYLSSSAFFHTFPESNVFSNNNGMYISASSIQSNVTWNKRPFRIVLAGTQFVGGPNGGSLTLGPGLTLELTGGFEIARENYFTGSLIADGTTEKIILTSTEEMKAENRTWSSIAFGSGNTAGSKLINCDISNGGNTSTWNRGMIHCYLTVDTPIIKDCTLSNSSSYAISISNASPVLENNTFVNNPEDIHIF